MSKGNSFFKLTFVDERVFPFLRVFAMRDFDRNGNVVWLHRAFVDFSKTSGGNFFQYCYSEKRTHNFVKLTIKFGMVAFRKSEKVLAFEKKLAFRSACSSKKVLSKKCFSKK